MNLSIFPNFIFQSRIPCIGMILLAFQDEPKPGLKPCCHDPPIMRVPSLIPTYEHEFLCVLYLIISVFTIQLKRRTGRLVVHRLKGPDRQTSRGNTLSLRRIRSPQIFISTRTGCMLTFLFPFQAKGLHWTASASSLRFGSTLLAMRPRMPTSFASTLDRRTPCTRTTGKAMATPKTHHLSLSRAQLLCAPRALPATCVSPAPPHPSPSLIAVHPLTPSPPSHTHSRKRLPGPPSRGSAAAAAAAADAAGGGSFHTRGGSGAGAEPAPPSPAPAHSAAAPAAAAAGGGLACGPGRAGPARHAGREGPDRVGPRGDRVGPGTCSGRAGVKSQDLSSNCSFCAACARQRAKIFKIHPLKVHFSSWD